VSSQVKLESPQLLIFSLLFRSVARLFIGSTKFHRKSEIWAPGVPLCIGPLKSKINLQWNDTNVVSTSLHGVDAGTLMNRRKYVATLVKSKPEAPPDQVQRFERKLREVKLAVENLPGEEYHAELSAIVRRAGWTTLAEGIFFEALVESILAHTRDLEQLHQRLKAAFEAVQGD
jgi:hypothetical protein